MTNIGFPLHSWWSPLASPGKEFWTKKNHSFTIEIIPAKSTIWAKLIPFRLNDVVITFMTERTRLSSLEKLRARKIDVFVSIPARRHLVRSTGQRKIICVQFEIIPTKSTIGAELILFNLSDVIIPLMMRELVLPRMWNSQGTSCIQMTSYLYIHARRWDFLI